MMGLFCFVLAVLASPFKSKFRLEAENAVLRRQLMVLTRRLRRLLSPQRGPPLRSARQRLPCLKYGVPLRNLNAPWIGTGIPVGHCAMQWLGSAGRHFFGAHAKQVVHDISSSSDLSATRKRAASPPVTMRWSKVSDNGSTRLTAAWPRCATARWEIR